MTKYKIIRKIGTGAFGNVYLLQTNRSKKFALKTVNTLRLNRNEEECCTEGTLMLKLCHTHLVYCYDAFLCSPHLYLILELCIHGSLEQYIHGRKSLISERRICSWMTQMADVLRYLHALKVIHRDLKPANVFLDEKENIRLGDLGVARELDHTVQERHTVAGTLPYMSPEAFCGLPYNFKTDIWSLGCCIHETMTLNKTFQGHSWAELHHMITSSQIPEMPATYHSKLQDLVLSLLNIDYSNRPDALEILHGLFKIQGKQFSSEPLQAMSVDAFDQKQICHAVKTFELSSESGTIKPLRACADGSHEESKLAENFTDNQDDKPDSRSTTASNERYNQQRPLPVPKARRKNKILKTLANSKKKDDDTETDEWTQQYIDNLAKDSIKWLRERFKPNDRQVAALESSDEEESDEEVAGLITLFTQSQTAIYIHRQSRMTEDATDENLQKKVMVDDMSESVIEAARKTIDVFQGQDPHLLKQPLNTTELRHQFRISRLLLEMTQKFTARD